MSNLNKIYHKGKFRSGEWAKHLRPFLKRQGNKRFRKSAITTEEELIIKHFKTKRINRRQRIRALITTKLNDGSTLTYHKNYRSMKDLKNAIKRTNVIAHTLINQKSKKHKNQAYIGGEL